MDWLGGRLRVERGIVRQKVGDVKTLDSGKLMSIDAAMLATLKTWKQDPVFFDEDWIFATRLSLADCRSYPWVWIMFQQRLQGRESGS